MPRAWSTLTRGQVAGVAVALCGVLLFLSDKLLGGQWSASAGDLVLVVAASFFSYYTVAAKPLIERHGGVVVMTYAVLLGSAPVVLISLPAGLQVQWAQLSLAVWAGMFYAVLISAFLGWLVWGWVNAVRGVARSAPLMYLMPPVAGLVAWAVTGESYTGIKLAGAALALAGVALAQFAGRAQRPGARSGGAGGLRLRVRRGRRCSSAIWMNTAQKCRVALRCTAAWHRRRCDGPRRGLRRGATAADLRICTDEMRTDSPGTE